MSEYVLRVYGLAGTQERGAPAPVGAYVAAYDPEGHDGRGDVLLTDVPARAYHWPSAETAVEAWQAVPANRPVRADGRPNRPLTAYSVMVEPAPTRMRA